jgi:DNA polymerase (family 10)
VTNQEIAQVLNEIGDRLDILGEDSFKVGAYRRAARVLEQEPYPAEALVAEGRLQELRGIGKAIATKVADLLREGRSPYLERLREQVPDSVTELLKVPGIGPRTAGRLWREMGISNLAELEAAARSGALRGKPGIGGKTEANILAAIERLRARPDRLPLFRVYDVARAVKERLRALPSITDADAAGSVRRWQPTVGDLDFVAASTDPPAAIRAFVQFPEVGSVVAQGETEARVLLSAGVQADLRTVHPEAYGSLLQHFTGSKEHNIQLRELASTKGLSISEYGVKRLSTGETKPCATEEDVYRMLGLDLIPPEIRHGSGEIEAAARHTLPKLVAHADIRGDLQCHTSYSDGSASVLEMALAAKDLGYDYLAITDHSPGRANAGGLSLERLEQQAAEVAEVRRQVPGITLLHGSEVDIRADGSLDLPDEVLARLDLVVAAVHSAMGQPRERVTARVLAAVRHPLVDVLAHPTGRLLGERDPIDLDLDAVFAAAAESGVALEINAGPSRLDLDGSLARQAHAAGVLLCVNTDAHATAHLASFMPWGVAQARRAWLTADDLLNCRPAPALMEWLAARKKRASARVGR